MNALQAVADIAEEGISCLRCGDAGTLRIPGEMALYTRCSCRRRVRGVPRPRLTDTFETFRATDANRKAYIRVQAVAKGREWSAFLTGDYGTGKTHLAIAALNAAGAGNFWKVPAYLDYVRFCIHDRELPQAQVISDTADDPDLVVFDDLGVEKRTEWAGEVLYRVLDRRCDLQLPTIITSNVALSSLDGRLVSRYATGLVVCAGRDARRSQV